MSFPPPRHREYADRCRQNAPGVIDDFWTRSDDDELSSTSHLAAEGLFHAFDDNVISELLQDPARLKLLNDFLIITASECFNLFSDDRNIPESRCRLVLLSPCAECNAPYDSGICTHSHEYHDARDPLMARRFIPIDGTAAEGPQIKFPVHSTAKLMAVLANLLTRDDCYELVEIVAPEDHTLQTPPPASNLYNRTGKDLIILLLGAFSTALPKVSYYGAACLSLLVSRAPARTFARLDPQLTWHSLRRHLEAVMILVRNHKCSLQRKWGFLAYINIIPLLYWLGDWKAANELMSSDGLPCKVFIILTEFIASFAGANGEEEGLLDTPIDYDTCPELHSAVNFMSHIMGELGREKPLSWALAASVEVLGRWEVRGISMEKQVFEEEGSAESVRSLLVDIKNVCRAMGSDKARLVTERIIAKLEAGETPELPAMNESILRQPLERMRRRCALCGSEGGSKYQCAGDCNGLACYCSKEHQREHWKVHKVFCKGSSV